MSLTTFLGDLTGAPTCELAEPEYLTLDGRVMLSTGEYVTIVTVEELTGYIARLTAARDFAVGRTDVAK